MAAVMPNKCRFYYPLKTNSADGQASPQRSCQAGGDDRNLVNSAFTQADDYWNGALGRFDLDTPTVALRGQYFHVIDFVAADDKLVLAKTLPATPATGGSPDTFRLFFGGNYRSSEPIPGKQATGLSNVTGVVIAYAAHIHTDGNGTLSFINASNALTWQAPGAAGPGDPVVVAGDGTYVVYSENEDEWLELTVTDASLPGENQSDTIAIAGVARQVLPDWEGNETENAPKTRYHLLPFKNEDGSEDMVDVVAFLAAAATGTPTQLAEGIGTTAGEADIDDGADWPTRSFWVYNVDKDDIRYVKNRSGNTLRYAAAGAGLRGFTAVAWDIDDDVQIFPEIDIGVDAPSSGQFENPANETTAPAGVTFSAPETVADGIQIGDIGPGEIYGIWVREHIVDGVRSRVDYFNQVRLRWQ